MTIEQASKWMQAGSAMVIVFGVMIALGAHQGLNGPLVFLADVMIWPFDGVQTGNATEFHLLSAIGGGVMVGWGLMLLMLSGRGMREAPALSKTLITYSIVCWFIVDTTGSIITNAPINALGNLGFLAIFLLPLRSVQV